MMSTCDSADMMCRRVDLASRLQCRRRQKSPTNRGAQSAPDRSKWSKMTGNASSVVVVSQHYPPDRSGNASRIRDTSVHLRDEGWDVTVLAPPPAFPHGQFDRTWQRKSTRSDDGVTVTRLWAWQPTTEDPGFLSRLAYYVLFPLHALMWLLFNHRRYDAVVTSSPPIFTGIAALPIARLRGVPWIVDVRDLWIDASVGLGFISEGGLPERLSRRLQAMILRTADRITVTTTVLGERLVDQYGVNDATIVHLPNGVDTTEYESTSADPGRTIVYTGNVGHAQDLESCIRAMSVLDSPDVTLRIVGDGDKTDDLKRLVDAHGLGDRVEFTGLVPRGDVPDLLNDAVIGIAPLKRIPTLEYAVPTKAYEYMSCELPVVATGVGEIESLIDESGGGLFVENDAERLAAAFDALLEDERRRESLGANGREHMVERYDRGVVANRLGRLLTEVIES